MTATYEVSFVNQYYYYVVWYTIFVPFTVSSQYIKAMHLTNKCIKSHKTGHYYHLTTEHSTMTSQSVVLILNLYLKKTWTLLVGSRRVSSAPMYCMYRCPYQWLLPKGLFDAVFRLLHAFIWFTAPWSPFPSVPVFILSIRCFSLIAVVNTFKCIK